jgi:HJR/Mrr/RecB family endonuclease
LEGGVINEELKAAGAAMAVLSTDPNSYATIKVLRQAKYVAALALTTLASAKPLNDARHAVVTTLSDLVHALETDRHRDKTTREGRQG